MSIETEVVETVHSAVSQTLKDGLAEYLKGHLFGYRSPFEGLIKDAVKSIPALDVTLKDAVTEVMEEPETKVMLKAALRKRMVNELVKCFSLDGVFKELRNNPETKQRLVDALEKIVA